VLEHDLQLQDTGKGLDRNLGRLKNELGALTDHNQGRIDSHKEFSKDFDERLAEAGKTKKEADDFNAHRPDYVGQGQIPAFERRPDGTDVPGEIRQFDPNARSGIAPRESAGTWQQGGLFPPPSTGPGTGGAGGGPGGPGGPGSFGPNGGGAEVALSGGLPTAPGDGMHSGALNEARSWADSGANPLNPDEPFAPGESDASWARDVIGEHGYWSATRDYISGHSDNEAMGRFADAATATDGELSDAFKTMSAAGGDIRRWAASSEWYPRTPDGAGSAG
jgi:hypothetical protein